MYRNAMKNERLKIIQDRWEARRPAGGACHPNDTMIRDDRSELTPWGCGIVERRSPKRLEASKEADTSG